MRSRTPVGVVLGSLLPLALLAPGAGAGLISSESFDYTRGESLHGKTGGFGWSIPWSSASANQSIFGPGLTHPQASSSGNAVSMGAAAALRYFGSDINPGTTGFWASFLVNRLSSGSGGAIQFVGPTGSETTLGVAISFGAANSPVLLAETTLGNIGAFSASPAAVSVGNKALLVVRVVPLGTTYRADLYINPTAQDLSVKASLTLANTTSLRGVALTGVASGQTVFDEVRVGDTLSDVTNIPTPGAAGVGGVLLAFAAASARRRPSGRAGERC